MGREGDGEMGRWGEMERGSDNRVKLSNIVLRSKYSA
jgi:hypothetical protein